MSKMFCRRAAPRQNAAPRTSKAQGMLSALGGSDDTPVRSVGAT